jgi:tetratricopeptide (TPR) repeat protein
MRPTLVLMMVVCTTTVAATQDPRRDLARPHLRAGQDALRAEHWDEAEREFKSAIELDPQLDLAHYGLGQAYMGSRRYQDALAAFTACRDVYLKNEVDRLSNKVDAERRLDDRILMLRDYRRSLDTGRQRTQNTAATISRLDSEIAQLEALRRRTPSEAPEVAPYISTALGGAHFRLGAFADAEREWRSALAIDPGLGEVHNNLAVVCMMTDRVAEAAQHVKLAEKAGVRVNPQLKKDIEARQP